MSIKIVEVGPRDGLQNISQTLPTSTKVELIERLAAAGLTNIEATSFVSPRWVPQLSDAKEVLRGISPRVRSKVDLLVLVPNIQGLRLAHQSHVKEVAVFVSATEGFSKRNINCTVDESLERARKVLDEAKSLGIRVRGYVSCIFSDPYDGPTSPQQVIKVTKFLLDAGCYEVSLGDTLGVGTPGDVQTLFQELFKFLPKERLAGHFHDTYGQAIANVVKSYEMGIRTFDSSVAGLGGCPFAKGAKGNLATEDLVYTLHRMGISTNVNLNKLVQTGSWISKQLGIPNGSRAGAALAAREHVETVTHTTPKKPMRNWSIIELTNEFNVQRNGATLKVVLTRPKNGNALTKQMAEGLTRVFTKCATDKEIFRVVLSAEGKYFCTGMDLRTPITPADQIELLRNLFEAIDQCPQTTIALINGPCFGGGVGLAFVCDLRIAKSSAIFKLSEIRLGLCPATISKYVFREWGISFARSAMLTARDVSPKELLQTQAIYQVVNSDEELKTAEDNILDVLRYAAPEASGLCKELALSAWKEPGSRQQATTIQGAFSRMMRESSEFQYGRDQFRKGIKGVDWENRKEAPISSKL